MTNRFIYPCTTSRPLFQGGGIEFYDFQPLCAGGSKNFTIITDLQIIDP